jgi:glycosyltransferase involved in cell wall biosynthesis
MQTPPRAIPRTGAASACCAVLPIRAFGGHEKMLLEWLSQATARHGLRVQVYCAPNERLIGACERAGLGAPTLSHPRRGGSLRDFFATWRLLGRIPRRVPVLFAPGVVQTSPLQWLAAFVRRRRVAVYVPMAYSSRQMRFRGGAMRDWVVGRLARRVDLWVTITAQQRDLLIGRWGVKSPVLVVPNRLSLLGHDACPARDRVDGPLRVLFAGRFERGQKGLDWLCERLRARRQDWMGRLRFTFKGQGDFGAALERLSRELGSSHVQVSPWGELAEAMRGADALLVPSRFEGLPLVALEATHYGVPVVASRNAGLAELLPPSCLFEFGDERAMWAALEELRDPAKRAAALTHARERIQRLLSPASYDQGVEQLVAALARMSGSAAESA